MKLRCKLAALALGLSTIAAFAQTGNDTLRIKEEGKIEFNPHWYMQVQGGVSHTIGESKFGDLISPAVALYGGYHSPIYGDCVPALVVGKLVAHGLLRKTFINTISCKGISMLRSTLATYSVDSILNAYLAHMRSWVSD